MITPRDRCALEYLEDVRYVVGPMGLSLEFHFATNPYFYNKVRTFYYRTVFSVYGSQIESTGTGTPRRT